MPMLQPAGHLHLTHNRTIDLIALRDYGKPLIERARETLSRLVEPYMVEQRLKEYCKEYDLKGFILNVVHEHVLATVRTSREHPYQVALTMLHNLVPPDEVKQGLRDYCTKYDLAPPWFGNLKGKPLSAVGGSRIKATFLNKKGKKNI